MPEAADDLPGNEWILNTLADALTFLTKTGSKKDARRALAALAVLHDVHPVRTRAGKSPAVIKLGDLMVCIDYYSQPVTVGALTWLSVDFGENLQLGEKMRKALSEGEKNERNRCVVLHRAAAYEWVLQGCPRRPPALSRVGTVGSQLRQSEYRKALDYVSQASQPVFLRDFEMASSAHDVLSAHHYRGFEDMDLFFSAFFKESGLPLVVVELNLDAPVNRSRALVFSDVSDFSIDKAMVLGCGITIPDS